MTDCFKVEFQSNTTLVVYEKDTAWDGRLVLIQPFNPETGNSWLNEQDALDWWDTVKHQYGPPETVVIEEEQSQEDSNG
jgi:hypothetical protein